MTQFEKLALRGLWLILRRLLLTEKGGPSLSEAGWAVSVAEALGLESMRNL